MALTIKGLSQTDSSMEKVDLFLKAEAFIKVKSDIMSLKERVF
jgi:hypothetical protein